MIGIIGTQDESIGFGLAGVHRIEELPPNPTKEDIIQSLKRMGDVQGVIINEDNYRLIADDRLAKKYFMIIIPSSHKEEMSIKELAKDVLGITLKEQ